jgi:hypothetical protein
LSLEIANSKVCGLSWLLGARSRLAMQDDHSATNKEVTELHTPASLALPCPHITLLAAYTTFLIRLLQSACSSKNNDSANKA